MAHRVDSDRCFIISPIGNLKDKNDEMRAHVERVRNELINEALKIANKKLGTNLKAIRSDLDPMSENIMEAVVRSILSDQLIFVVLTSVAKPNVYYELGIAKSAARPVIILKEDNLANLNFDMLHLKYTEYSLGKPAADGNNVGLDLPVAELAETIIRTYGRGEGEHAFGNPTYDPLNKQGGRITIYDKFLDVKYADWSRMMNLAERSIDFVGTTLLDLNKIDNDRFRLHDRDPTSDRALVDFIAAKVLFGGIDVTVTIVHEDNPALESMLKGSSDGGADPRFYEQVRQEIDWSTRRWMDVANGIERFDEGALGQIDLKALESEPGDALPPERRGTFRFVKLLRGQVKFRMTLTDRDVLATPILYRHGRNSSGPAFRARADTAIYASLKDELGYLLDLNKDNVLAHVRPEQRRRRR